ncbi:PI-stichotoxin-She2a-like [Anticarsia gemmatalis]|uniref:PI-stichotoxin-She2a-like n=1 Tax=Anticarsia gemmatalis TaxID=129554 RepID=UPI003F777DCC
MKVFIVIISVFIAGASAVVSEDQREAICRQPIKGGICVAYFERYAYDVSKGECVGFIYGGCGGNENNFVYKKDCEVFCGRVEDDKSNNFNFNFKSNYDDKIITNY